MLFSLTFSGIVTRLETAFVEAVCTDSVNDDRDKREIAQAVQRPTGVDGTRCEVCVTDTWNRIRGETRDERRHGKRMSRSGEEEKREGGEWQEEVEKRSRYLCV